MKYNDRKLKVGVAYYLIAKVKHRVFQGITRTKIVKQELLFTCNPGITVLPAASTTMLPANKLFKDCGINSGNETHSSQSDSPPAYSPALQMELFLPDSPVLVLGRGNAVRLVMYTPAEILGRDDIYIRCVTMQLKVSTSARIRNTWHNVIEMRHGCSIVGVVPVTSERFELELGSWDRFTITNPNTRPTSSSCLLDLAYALEIATGISKGSDGPIHVSSALFFDIDCNTNRYLLVYTHVLRRPSDETPSSI